MNKDAAKKKYVVLINILKDDLRTTTGRLKCSKCDFEFDDVKSLDRHVNESRHDEEIERKRPKVVDKKTKSKCSKSVKKNSSKLDKLTLPENKEAEEMNNPENFENDFEFQKELENLFQQQSSQVK